MVQDEAGELIDFEYLDHNAAFSAIAGVGLGELIGRRGSGIWPAESVVEFLSYVAQVRDAGKPQTFEYYDPRLKRHFQSTLFVTGPDEFGLIARDISRRRGNETQLELLATALDQAGESILITDTTGRIEYVNQAFMAISGYSEAEALGQVPWELLDTAPAAEDEDQTPLWHRILGRERWSGRAVKRAKDGRLYHTESTATAIRGDDGEIRHHVMIDRDVTRQIELEERLRQASKLEAIGGLAGGLAHDFNNMLTVISGHCEMLAETALEQGFIEQAPQMASDLQQIDEAVSRAVTLTRRLMAFSRRETSQRRVVGMNGIVSGMSGFLRRLLGEAVNVKLDLADELGNIKVDPAQIEQVLMNLAINARDAMDARGRLEMGTSEVELGREYAAQHPEVVPGQYVRLTVTDTGCGMDEATRARLFEPFFTTKRAGEGTGLGMAVVHGIVGQNQGHIQCYSEPGQGTTFNVYFPVVDEAPRDIAVPEATPQRGGDERILVVEDDPAVRKLTVMSLRSAGYKVASASSGVEALAVTEEPALLITDLTLGDTDGMAVMDALTARWPGLRTLCMSGYPLASLDRRLDTRVIPNFLPKPFSPGQLRDAVREILDR